MCDPAAESVDCGVEGTITLTEGPATAKYTIAPVVDPNGETALYDPLPHNHQPHAAAPLYTRTPTPPAVKHT